MSENSLKLIFLISFLFLIARVFCAPQHETSYRYCQIPEETFFNGECRPIGSSEHCPTNMQLFDTANTGFCDCVEIEGNPAFYFDETGGCSFHNTQGPCLSGEWLVLKNEYPLCEPVPEGCPADGNHFYGSPDETMAEQCWEIGTQGPCGPDETMQLDDDTGELKIFCKYSFGYSIGSYLQPDPIYPASYPESSPFSISTYESAPSFPQPPSPSYSAPSSIANYPSAGAPHSHGSSSVGSQHSCRKGTLRNRIGHCVRGFYG